MIDPIARLDAALAGRYSIERELGTGAMATVYPADDLRQGLAPGSWPGSTGIPARRNAYDS